MVGALQEAAHARPWTPVEKQKFEEAFLVVFKDFKQLAERIGTRSVLEVTQYFYEVHKKDVFKVQSRKFALRKRQNATERGTKNSMFGPLSTSVASAAAAPPAGTPAARNAAGGSARSTRAPPLPPRRGGTARAAAVTAPPAAAPAAASRRRSAAINPDAFCAEARLHGQAFQSLARALHVPESSVREYWAQNAQALGLVESDAATPAASEGSEPWASMVAQRGLDMAPQLTGEGDTVEVPLTSGAAFPKLDVSLATPALPVLSHSVRPHT